MSIISHQVEELRQLAKDFAGQKKLQRALTNAADIIETQSAKLAAANMERSNLYYNNGWIPCEEYLPEEKVNPLTLDFFEYEVTFESENARDIRHYKFGRGHWWHGGGIVDGYVVAWRPLPEPYRKEM